MPGLWQRWNTWLFPEFARFPDEQSRNAIGWEFQSRAGVFNWRIGVLMLFAIPIGLLTPWLAGRVQTWLPVPSPMLRIILSGAVIGGLQGLVFATYLNWAFRKPMRRFLREKLNELGVPTCIGCGYDIRGLAEPRCPECGRPFAHAASPLPPESDQ